MAGSYLCYMTHEDPEAVTRSDFAVSGNRTLIQFNPARVGPANGDQSKSAKNAQAVPVSDR